MESPISNSRLTSIDEKNLNTVNVNNGYSSRTGESERIRQYQSEMASISAAVPRSIPECTLDASIPGLREILGDVRRKGDCTRKAEAPPTGQPQAQPLFQRRQSRRQSNCPDHPGNDGDSDSDGEENSKKNYGGDAGKVYGQNSYLNERAFAQNALRVTQPQNLRDENMSP